MATESGRFRVKPAGIALALVAFLLTRTVVAGTIDMDVMTGAFLVGPAPFLVLGLAVAVVGIGLALGSVTTAYARTVLLWSVLGASGGALVSVSVYLEALLSAGPTPPAAAVVDGRAPILGLVGGTITGFWAARSGRTRRALSERSNRLLLLNRLLRHEVFNGLHVIHGHAGADDGSSDAIQRSADRIHSAVETAGTLAAADAGRVAAERVVDEAVASVRTTHEADVGVEMDGVGDVSVVGDESLTVAVEELIANAVEYGGSATVRVQARPSAVRLVVADEGDGLPAPQRALLTDREFSEYTDTPAGFGVATAALVFDRLDAEVDVSTDEGTRIAVDLPRDDVPAYGLDATEVGAAVAASFVAGGTMGVVLSTLTGSIPVIGALYGVPNPTVGWLTHLFHSVVFGLGFAGVMTTPTLRPHRDRIAVSVGVCVGYGLALALVAAGLIMPAWLAVVGVEAPFPNVTAPVVFGHLVWGVTLGALLPGVRRWTTSLARSPPSGTTRVLTRTGTPEDD